MGDKRTAPSIYAMKAAGQKVVCITAYDSTSGAIVDAANPDLVLVGDSVGNTMLGYSTTLFVELDDMVRHTRAVATSVDRPLLVADMPFGSYQSSVCQAVDSAVALMRAGAEAVKLEGDYFDEISAILKAGIPVMGHVGMTPQSYHQFGGFKVQGKEDPSPILEVAKELDSIGVFSIVLELIPSNLASQITAEVSCPTIGIGAGDKCDGQIQVYHDVVGLTSFKLKHAKRYAEGMDTFKDAMNSYATEVRNGAFPGPEHSF